MPSADLMKRTYFCITVDVDPDVNIPVKGQAEAVSHPLENNEVRFESCAAGLKIILSLLNELELPATFFVEARTAEQLNSKFGMDLSSMLRFYEVGSHSYMHEDFVGKDTGVLLNKDQMRDTLKASLEIMNNIFNRPIKGFRAPYDRINDMLAEVLVEMGFEYDSSTTETMQLRNGSEETKSKPIHPYYYFENKQTSVQNPQALLEVPLSDWVLPDGKKLTSYLWPYLEEDMSFDSYYNALKLIGKMPKIGSLMLLATHPWHLVETYAKGIIDDEQRENILTQLRSNLISLKRSPDIEFITITDYLDIWHSARQREDLGDIFANI
jgi:peptidoglycan/xylan/chitin deacetylase (PgdA/CDA1 family)